MQVPVSIRQFRAEPIKDLFEHFNFEVIFEDKNWSWGVWGPVLKSKTPLHENQSAEAQNGSLAKEMCREGMT